MKAIVLTFIALGTVAGFTIAPSLSSDSSVLACTPPSDPPKKEPPGSY